jgi:hypothetical protein
MRDPPVCARNAADLFSKLLVSGDELRAVSLGPPQILSYLLAEYVPRIFFADGAGLLKALIPWLPILTAYY